MEVIKKEKQMKEVDVVVENYIECDKCHCKITTGCYDVFESNFTYKTGDSYPEGGSGDEHTMDFCKKCGIEAMELLKSNGFKVNSKEWDW